MTNTNENNERELSIELDQEMADGVYANLVVINHSSSEFVLDFVNVMPGMPKAHVRSRVVLAPEHAKRLLAALADNIEKYENANGNITYNRC
ncbi:DUF3467 domain-containing protein [Capnocytophaga haemolytica]